MNNFFERHFQSVDDPRSVRNQRHPFITIIVTSLLSILSGIDSFSGFQDFVEVHFEELAKFLHFPGGVPSHDTYRRFWNAISPTQFLKSFSTFTETLKDLDSKIISLDGKTIRNSGTDTALHIVSAWCKSNQLVLAQEKVYKKSNELTAIPKLLNLLDIQGCIITIDAMGAQRAICQQIIDEEGDYVISLKGNQGTLHDDVKLFLSDTENHLETNENNDKGHGRLEQRISRISTDVEWLQESHKWPGLKSIGRIESIILKKGKERREMRYYISSLELTAMELNDIARSHWGIENQLHWRLDVVFNEDKCCIRNDNAAENFDIMRKWALNILMKVKTKPEQSIKSIMRKNSMSIKYLLNSVNKIFHA
jgi:predicted transposase YbfD/YdcC